MGRIVAAVSLGAMLFAGERGVAACVQAEDEPRSAVGPGLLADLEAHVACRRRGEGGDLHPAVRGHVEVHQHPQARRLQ